MSWRGLPLAQATAIVAGVVLMAAPAVFEYADTTADDVHRVVGPSLVAVGIIAISRVTWGVRWVAPVLALALVVAPVFGGHPAASLASAIVSAAAVWATVWFPGRSDVQLGGGWRAA